MAGGAHAHAGPVDRRDDGLGLAQQAYPGRRVVTAIVVAVEACFEIVLDVGTCAEAAARAGDDDGADGGVLVAHADGVRELPAHLVGPRVHSLRPVQRENGDGILRLE
jgi:hypothetical protein